MLLVIIRAARDCCHRYILFSNSSTGRRALVTAIFAPKWRDRINLCFSRYELIIFGPGPKDGGKIAPDIGKQNPK